MHSQQVEWILGALHDRRSVPLVQTERPPRAVVEQILAAATTAPNHYRTRPWRFLVLAGEERLALGRVFAQSAARRAVEAGNEPPDPATLERESRKPLRAPVVIVAACEPSESPKTVEIEEIEATAAAVQNMLIAAHAFNLGAMWRTGAPAYDPDVKRFLGVSSRAHIVGFVYLGYPAELSLPDRATDEASVTTWRGWDEHDLGAMDQSPSSEGP